MEPTKGVTFELFSASIPRRCLTSWQQPLPYLEALAYRQVYEAKAFLTHYNIDHALGWYGDPNSKGEELKFKLLLVISDTKQATVFRLCSGLATE